MNKNIRFGKLFLCLSIGVAIAGCSSKNNIPEGLGLEYASKDYLSKVNEDWVRQEPSIQYVDRGGSLLISGPMSIPDEIRAKKIHADFARGSTLADLSAFFSTMGINFVIKSDDVARSKILIPGYVGNLGDFIKLLSLGHGISFSWHEGNTIIVDSSALYVLKIAQDEDIAKAMSKELAALGADAISTSIQTGTVSYKANSENQERIVSYLKRSSLNTAMISMQVAIITVSMDKNRSTGIDWSALNLALGNIPSADGSSPGDSGLGAPDPELGGITTAIPGTTAGALSSGLSGLNGSANITGEGSGFTIKNKNLTLKAAVNYLSTYGKTETNQSVLMKTLSGKEVKIKSGQKIPYVDSIGVSTSNNDNDINSNSLGSANIKDVDIGLDLKLMPLYDSDSELVTVNVDMKLSTLLSFIELSAGNQLGTVTRPNTQSQEFTDVIKMKAGESALIGGVSFDSISDNRAAPAFLEKAGVASRSNKFNKNTMFIMIRPSVTVYGNFNNEK